MFRKVLVLTAAMFALFVTAAQAHTATATVSCGAANITYSDFADTGSGNGGFNSPTYSITFTPVGGTATTQSGQILPGFTTSDSPTYTFALPPVDGTVVIHTAVTTAQTRDHTSGSLTLTFDVTACPTISTTATPATATVGQPVTDVAHLGGGIDPTGTISFSLYGPNNPTCTGNPLQTVTTAVSGDGDYSSPPVTPTSVGSYVWVAKYSGDSINPNNIPLSGGCGAADETVTITPATPALTTTATPSAVTVGQPVADVAHLTGGDNPSGTITFKLYGPTPTTCTGTPVATVTTTVHGDGDYTSPSTTPSGAGSYVWVASYSGDSNNVGLSNGCAETTETVTVGPTTPALTTTATPSTVTIGQPVADVAHLSGGLNPTGTITFNLYGPTPTDCTGTPVASVTTTVNGDGDYTSPTTTPTVAGSYVWVASYTGDTNNVPLQNGCAEATETVTVAPATPTLTTTATPPTVTIGQPVADVAHLGGGSTPTGTITFNLYGPTPTDCTGTPVASVVTAVNGDGDYSSPTTIPTVAGSYVWVASYSGDANNVPLQNGCAEASETVTVAPAPTSPPPLTPGFTLAKVQSVGGSAFTASPITADVGQTIDYQVIVTNTGNEPLNLALVDTMCSSFAGPNGGALTGTLAVGATDTWTCSHVVVAGDRPTYVNVAQVTATPPSGTPLPVQRASVLANIPAANVAAACVASPVKIKQTTTNDKKTVNAIVTGGGLKKVVFALDGRTVKTLTKPNLSGNRYELSVTVSSTRYGSHKITATATNTCNKAVTDGVVFTRNVPVKPVVPKFTG